MKERNCFTLIQNRNEDSNYNNFTGKFYHFPKKYYKQLSEAINIEFVYYEPPSCGKGEYFGSGKISHVFKDKTNAGFYFAEIIEYKPFSTPVPFRDSEGNQREFGISYNAQNAVRKIKPELLDEICLDGGIILNFMADAHLIQILGEQLIESERIGILELVKNGFDAGATYCKVRIEKVPGLPDISKKNYQFSEYEGPVIIIEDNGSGMSKQDIENGWLRPASTLKTDVKQRIKKERIKAIESGKEKSFEKFMEVLKAEYRGRIPLGEKGVGRFACHRLGKKLIIKSKTNEIDYEYLLEINWDDFNNIIGENKNLSSVGVTLKKQALSRDYGRSNSGTQLIIFGGRDGFELDEDEIICINRTILKLNTPNPNPKAKQQDFVATFECPQVKGLQEKVNFAEYKPVFTITGIVDSMGILTYDFKFSPPYHKDIPLASIDIDNQILDLRTIESKKDKWFEVINGKKMWRTPQCGSFYIHLDIWYRDKPWRDNLDDSFLEYLNDFGGISIFRDGINIYPAEWGAEKDWLGLRQRQIKQTKRMSYYHMLGNVEIEQGINILLMDKTSREGLVGNRAAKDLQQLVKAVTFFMENYYMGKRKERDNLTDGLTGDPKIIHNDATASSKIISNIKDNYEIEKDPNKLLTELEEPSKRKVRLEEISNSLAKLKNNLILMEESNNLLTEQAGFGLGIAVALHEINKTASNFYYGILEIIENKNLDQVELHLKLKDLRSQSEALEAELSRLAPLRSLRNEKPQLIKISRSIKFIESIFEKRFEKIGIDFSYNKEDFEIIARFGGLNQIFTNLIDNSCFWLNNPSITEKKIRIEINATDRTVIVADTGPGIHDSILPHLFQPGYSLKDQQSGLGTYICRHYMNLMNKRGEIYLAKSKDRLMDYKGAQFYLDFSNVNSEL